MSAESKIFSTHRSDKSAEVLKAGFETLDPRFDALLPEHPALVHHWKGAEWAEGAVYLPRKKVVLFSDIPNDRMLQFDPATGDTTVFREPANFTNGHYVDLDGRLVSAQHLTHGITRTEHDGNVEMLVDRYEGKRLNSPNDLVVKSDGTIWFTDPPYGILSDREGAKRDSEVGGNFVFRYDPDSGDLTIVVDSMDRPNGIAFSPDESILYVADTGEPKNVLAFDVASDGRSLSNKRDFLVVRPGASDGFRCDVEGNIWTSAGDGVHCYTSEAELIGKILVPEQAVANCCFGGEDFRTLYIAGDTSLYSAELAVAGARPVV
jgi:gluconolactonase